MLKELFRTEPPKTMRERLSPSRIARFERAFTRIGLPDIAYSLLSLDDRRFRLDTLVEAMTAFADRIHDLEAKVRKLEGKE